MIHRPPVGYVTSFLESYRPDHDFYLDAKLRARLHALGRVPGAERPAGTYAGLDGLDLSGSTSPGLIACPEVGRISDVSARVRPKPGHAPI